MHIERAYRYRGNVWYTHPHLHRRWGLPMSRRFVSPFSALYRNENIGLRLARGPMSKLAKAATDEG